MPVHGLYAPLSSLTMAGKLEMLTTFLIRSVCAGGGVNAEVCRNSVTTGCVAGMVCCVCVGWILAVLFGLFRKGENIKSANNPTKHAIPMTVFHEAKPFCFRMIESLQKRSDAVSTAFFSTLYNILFGDLVEKRAKATKNSHLGSFLLPILFSLCFTFCCYFFFLSFFRFS